MKKINKIVALLLTLVMVASMATSVVFAAGPFSEKPVGGAVGDAPVEDFVDDNVNDDVNDDFEDDVDAEKPPVNDPDVGEDPAETPDPIKPVECKHENSTKKTQEATCTVDGLYYIYCHDCEKEVMNIVLAATGHNMVADKIEPTCTEDGSKFSACDKCGEKSAFQSVIPAKGHDFVDGKCTACGELEDKEVGEPDDEIVVVPNKPAEECKHENKDKKVIEPTCEEDGLYYIYCHDCEKEVMNTVLPANGHTFEDFKCTVCGKSQLSTDPNFPNKPEDPEVGEDPNERPDPIRPVECKHENKDKKVVEPTCEEDGLYYIYCHDCEKEVMNTVLPANGHNWVADKIEPTCTVDGLEYSACDKCGEKSAFQAVIPAVGHDFEDGKCAVCGTVDSDADTDDSDDALLDCGHKYVELARKDATCTEDGYIDHDCGKHCGKSFRREILTKTGHNWVEEKVAPTCTEDGCEFSVCDKCGEKSAFQAVIPATGHTPAGEWARTGAGHWHKCSTCGEACDDFAKHTFGDDGKVCQVCGYNIDDPKTGDEFNIGLMIALIAFSVVGIGAVTYVGIRNKQRG